MSRIELTVQEMNKAINDLTSKNREFAAQVSQLEALQQELAAEWKGDSNTAFNAEFQKDKKAWTDFSSLVDNYIAALQNIMAEYNRAESVNLETAKNRTY